MKKNPVWSLNQSFYGDSFEKSKTPSLQWGLELNSPINKMQVKITGEIMEEYIIEIMAIWMISISLFGYFFLTG